VESSRIPFLEELQLFQRGIVISEIRLSEEKASGSIRAADLVQQAHAADALRGEAASRPLGSQKTLASARLIGRPFGGLRITT